MTHAAGREGGLCCITTLKGWLQQTALLDTAATTFLIHRDPCPPPTWSPWPPMPMARSMIHHSGRGSSGKGSDVSSYQTKKSGIGMAVGAGAVFKSLIFPFLWGYAFCAHAQHLRSACNCARNQTCTLTLCGWMPLRHAWVSNCMWCTVFGTELGCNGSGCNVRIRLQPRLLPTAFTAYCPLFEPMSADHRVGGGGGGSRFVRLDSQKNFTLWLALHVLSCLSPTRRTHTGQTLPAHHHAG